MDYSREITVIQYKKDSRRKDGWKQISVIELHSMTYDEVCDFMKKIFPVNPKFRYEVVNTYRLVKNMMSGADVYEHRNTPYSCSVASESYWSN